MLQAAIVGNVFTSPSSLSISTAISNVARLNGGGVLIFVLNYTGDVLNFGLATEEARNKGMQVECVVINDDCAISGTEMHTIAGRRGICGAVFMFKIAGALSSAGRVLSEIAIESRAVGCRLSTLGLCLAPCSVPGSGPLFTMDDNEMLLGVGIHGEAGTSSMQATSAPEAVRLLLASIIKNLVIRPGDNVCVLVNNLGSTTLLEMYIIVAEVKRQLEADYRIARLYVGTLMSSLDMRGVQISVLNVTGRDEWIQYLDIETEAFGWPGTKLSRINDKYPVLPINLSIDKNIELPEVEGMEIGESKSSVFRNCIVAVCNALIENEQKLNQLDSVGGDGDCGTTFRHMSKAVLNILPKLPFKHVSSCFFMMSQIAKIEMGGTSGALYSIMLLGASKTTTDWSGVWKNAIQLVQKYSGARLGHRTMFDALIPANEAYESKLAELDTDPEGWKEALKEAVAKAGEGCQNTINMIAKAGRASYVDPSKITDVDPGAFAVVVWLTAIYETLTELQSVT
ncbi:hypothetical protein AAG570_011512 [Ranatra chinensis]|uniref:Triokinase/FMN cyclase n=1 Tax=Ranatra chinensis TaxID=642074 RepID=A0ABD0YL52_9HEMI